MYAFRHDCPLNQNVDGHHCGTTDGCLCSCSTNLLCLTWHSRVEARNNSDENSCGPAKKLFYARCVAQFIECTSQAFSLGSA